MAKVIQNPKVELSVTFTINEDEARALDALIGYGDDAFIERFKVYLGEHYIRNHEAGLRSFMKSVRSFIPGILTRTDLAREAFNKGKANDAAD